MPWNGKECACPSGWGRHENRCYLLVSTPSKFEPALTDCKSKNATLVSINTESKYNFIKSFKNGQSIFVIIYLFKMRFNFDLKSTFLDRHSQV